jgi:hypothetical protein
MADRLFIKPLNPPDERLKTSIFRAPLARAAIEKAPESLELSNTLRLHLLKMHQSEYFLSNIPNSA